MRSSGGAQQLELHPDSQSRQPGEALDDDDYEDDEYDDEESDEEEDDAAERSSSPEYDNELVTSNHHDSKSGNSSRTKAPGTQSSGNGDRRSAVANDDS